MLVGALLHFGLAHRRKQILAGFLHRNTDRKLADRASLSVSLQISTLGEIADAVKEILAQR
jgi:hypothetical protein